MFSGLSLQSLLSLNPSLLTDASPILASPPQPLETLTNTTNNKLLIPKTEHPHHLLPQSHPFNFFPAPFHRLPQLRSPEPLHKRPRLDAANARGKAVTPTGTMIPQSNLARQRRQKLSEKTRCLQKLMPWDKKMDQGTLLEEAYKYVKFLQAQLCVLRSMPSHSQGSAYLGGVENGGVFGELEKLNRRQVLEVLVNSGVAQTMLYSQGLCVFSIEQLGLLRKLSDNKRQHQIIMSHPASSKPFFN
ncbi:hypothetical protein RJT34_28832 [Clitoria ternatea]|uniref:BHLH domain-containing protein n=1 Tax=Clitoria ternatea TaxID=43366 RepID=A0AAN9IAJ3_CLITE